MVPQKEAIGLLQVLNLLDNYHMLCKVLCPEIMLAYLTEECFSELWGESSAMLRETLEQPRTPPLGLKDFCLILQKK